MHIMQVHDIKEISYDYLFDDFLRFFENDVVHYTLIFFLSLKYYICIIVDFIH